MDEDVSTVKMQRTIKIPSGRLAAIAAKVGSSNFAAVGILAANIAAGISYCC